MATLTYDPTPADEPQFNEQEQEALAIGEQAAQEQSQMLAGKFKDAEALEQAYIELQKKLGEPDEDGADEVRREEDSSEEEVEVTESQQAVLDASAEYYQNDGQLSEETIAKLSSMDSKDLLDAYIATQQGTVPGPDISDADATAIQNMAGGEESYQQLMGWAADSLPEDVINGFDSLVDAGNPVAIQLAVRGLMAEYESQNGMEGQMLTGKAAPGKQDVFRSQSEVVQAMSDPRYDRDPAYRQDVFEKLNRSNIEY